MNLPVVGGESASVVEESGSATGEKDNKQSQHTGCQVECLKPCIYPSPSTSDLPPITAFYHVEDLIGLASFLQQGVELCVHLQKVVYSRSTRGGGAEYLRGQGADHQSGQREPSQAGLLHRVEDQVQTRYKSQC